MSSTMPKIVAVAAIFVAILTAAAVMLPPTGNAATGNAAHQDEKDKKQQDQGDSKDRVAKRDFMRAKLMFSKQIMEGLSNQDFKLISESAKELKGITEGAKWVTVDTPEYRRLAEQFVQSTESLDEASQSGNVDAAAMRFFDLTTRCIDCHKHLRKIQF